MFVYSSAHNISCKVNLSLLFTLPAFQKLIAIVLKNENLNRDNFNGTLMSDSIFDSLYHYNSKFVVVRSDKRT